MYVLCGTLRPGLTSLQTDAPVKPPDLAPNYEEESHHRTHYRIVFKEYGRGLHELTTYEEILTAIIGCITGALPRGRISL